MEMLSSPLGKAILVQLKAIVGVRLRALIRVSFTVYFLNILFGRPIDGYFRDACKC